METTTQLSKKKIPLDMYDSISMSVYEAKGVLIALSGNDNFKYLNEDHVSACLNVLLGKLEDIETAIK
jgi:hypothetical protein